MQNRYMVMSSMRNEGPYIVEWIAWNRVIGFTDIVIGTNDSVDGTTELLSRLADHGVIHFIDNQVAPDEAPQHAFNEKAQKLEIYQQAEWLAVLDADEFLNIHVGNGMLEDLLSLQKDVDIIQLNWAVFGDGGAEGFSDQNVTERYRQRIPDKHRINGGCKCLTRLPQRFGNIRNHNPVNYRGQRPLSVLSGSGQVRQLDHKARLTDLLQYTSAEDVSFEVAQINHYATKTRDEYLIRQQRGRGSISAMTMARQRYDEKYFVLRSEANIPDHSISRHHTALSRGMAALMEVPGIAEAVAFTRHRYREMIADLGGAG